MRIKDGFLLREVAGSYVVVPIGENLVDFQGMITLNESGAFLWKELKEDKTPDELVVAMLNEYDVDEQTAQADIEEFINLLKKHSLVEG